MKAVVARYVEEPVERVMSHLRESYGGNPAFSRVEIGTNAAVVDVDKDNSLRFDVQPQGRGSLVTHTWNFTGQGSGAFIGGPFINIFWPIFYFLYRRNARKVMDSLEEGVRA